MTADEVRHPLAAGLASMRPRLIAVDDARAADVAPARQPLLQ